MICPFARFQPIPPHFDSEKQPERFSRFQKTQLIVHSAGGGMTGSLDWWERKFAWGVYSTFFILRNGELVQLVDSSFRANANGDANQRAISVETESPVATDAIGWTDPQLETLVRLGRWTETEHQVPMSPCPAHDAPGFAFHTQFGNTPNLSPWLVQAAKTCPGLYRIRQYWKELLPALGYAPSSDAEAEVFARWSRVPRVPAPRAWSSARKNTKKRAVTKGKRAVLDPYDLRTPDRDEAPFVRRRNVDV